MVKRWAVKKWAVVRERERDLEVILVFRCLVLRHCLRGCIVCNKLK